MPRNIKLPKVVLDDDLDRSTKLLKEAFDSSEEKIKAIIAAIPDMIFVLSREGDYEEFYSAEANTSNLLVPKEFFLGKNVRDVLPGDLGLRFLEGFEKALTFDSLEIVEYTMNVTSGPKYFEARIAPIHSQNQLLCIIRDITARKLNEQELANALLREKELSELKSNFISNTSHEFRTPMSIIQSSADILENYYSMMKPDQVSYHFERIHSSIKFLTGMLDDILFIERSNARKVTYDPVMEDIVTFCEGLRDDVLSNDTKGCKIVINNRLAKRKQSIDVKLLHSVISNLLTNAIKYSPAGAAVLLDLSGSNGRIVIRVEDHGIGIAVEDLGGLFEPFFRGRNVEDIPGSGLGLQIVKRSLDLMNGTISVKSNPGAGTVFTVEIPGFEG